MLGFRRYLTPDRAKQSVQNWRAGLGLPQQRAQLGLRNGEVNHDDTVHLLQQI
jgi:hypothetical protein